ncbi:MAG: DUF5686 and carboxypeptidase regulatory-like domain-containing protein [Carboxylicivirga sp.]|jgi:hypothetical protein|nr:DUF5686 and carboxypeptidase regulatory-like domain-containing protein [Carboxylicivirga sp.]
MVLRIAISITIIFFSVNVYSQQVSGYIKDKDTDEPIPFASVYLKHTQQGIMTDLQGYFEINAPQGDTICASSVGYQASEKKIKRYADQKIVLYLTKEVTEIDDVTVKAKLPITKVIFKRIQKHKKQNRNQIRNVEDYKAVKNTTVYMALDTTSTVTRIFDDINEVTVELDGQNLRFSPIYLYEEALKTANGKDTIVYSRKDGIFPRINQAIETYILQNVVVDLDFYKDQIFIMDRGFISPISNNAMLYYNLYFNDSTRVDDKKYYHFAFAPKNKYNSLFSGRFTVEEGSYALTEIEAHISREANLNFINGFSAKVTYQKLPNDHWFYDKQEIDLNMSLSLNKDTAEISYSSERVNNVTSGNWLINKSTFYTTADELNAIKPKEWKDQQAFSYNRLGEETYQRVNNLKENDYVKAVDAIGGMALSSYLNMGKVDIGPVFSIYGTNTIEGTRVTVPLRTSEELFESFYVGGFLGYGTKSEEFKYGANIAVRPLPKDKFILRFSYEDDYNLVSQDKFLPFIKNNPNVKGNSNFIASFTTRERNPYLKEEQKYDFKVEYNAENDFHLEVSPYWMKSTNTPAVKFNRGNEEFATYKNYGVLMNMRYAFGQDYDLYFFNRVYYSTPTPIVNLAFDFGKTDVSNEGMYGQVHGSVQGRLIFGQVFMNYMLNGGFLFGDAPYDLLDQPVGSMSLGYAKYRFNLLHHAAMAHNLYTNTHLHFNGGGIVLNRIPLIKKLKLREVLSIKGHWGELNDSYKGVFDLPSYYSNDSSTPYAEIGFGFTNIFKVLRVEYVRLLGNSYQNKDYTDKNGIFFRAEMSF